MINRLMLSVAAIFAAVLFAPQLSAQSLAKPAPPSAYIVGKGETVMGIAAKLRYPSATEDQMAYAIVRKNPKAASARTKDRVLPGTKLTIPDEATVLATKPDVAAAAMTKLRKGEALYQDGVAAEGKGDMKAAVSAYIQSARYGHPLADLRLGELYDRDGSKTLPHDLQQSIVHYQKAREFGIEIRKQPRSPNVPAN